jgi:hypothetical protein
MQQNSTDLLKEFELQLHPGGVSWGTGVGRGLWKKLWREIRLPSESPSDCSLTYQPYSTVQFVGLCYLTEEISDLARSLATYTKLF